MYAKHTADPDQATTPHPCESWPDDGRSFRETLDRIGDKWSVLVIGILSGGPLRFCALHRRVPGVSQRMLTLTLRHLERDGVVSRAVYAEVPPRVEYQLTPLGESLRAIVHALAQWVTDHHGEIESARDRYDAG
ncbi:winged helix-turn-helix transcriptional regulator [Amycolatopsis saalfeldensis]|uniref:DNA-binding transcriptional regulator, HxlR family n=1 Tax=Amycolatopsis saalfeldensis TaxID=394193 RepID=A0A1H8SUY9_9PSEU|nr:helix-turn-helix domain-containing protein [Amycolatopsis saalfeldensis]SEO82590.1 DNA-binding transcriptional regulator, HxlR family [Amycolatopsis saalfeldensis]